MVITRIHGAKTGKNIASRRTILLALLFFCASFLLFGARKPRKKKSRKKSKPAPPLRVTPSPEIEARVQAEIQKAQDILANLDADRLFDSAYVASAIYYNDEFLTSYPTDKQDGDPARRIIAQVKRLMTPELKARYISLLLERYRTPLLEAGDTRFHAPVEWDPPKAPRATTKRGRRRRRRRAPRNHLHAIDIFTPEGSPITAAARGVVLIAESTWTLADPFSTSSRLGGNSVITFDPIAGRLYRYCHLDQVFVSAGVVVRAAQKIGTVGHTGLNASRKGHGGHLHFEVNEYDGRSVRALESKRLISILNTASSPGVPLAAGAN